MKHLIRAAFHPRDYRRGLRPSRRGRVLRVLALLWLLMGAYVAATGSAIDPADAILYEGWPIWLRVTMWCGSAAAAFIASTKKAEGQKWGWVALVAMPAERCFSHLWSLMHGIIPGEPPGTTWAGLLSALLWAAIARLVVLLAGWDEDTVEVP